MTSFGYRLNPRYAIKECLSCEASYTGDFCCSKGNVEDKILVPKLPKNCARCGHPVNGPYCQGCTLLREKLEEDLVTYFQNFQNTYESSDGSTNVVNAPREPFVFKQDHGVNPPHIDECCCECDDALDGIFCQQCTCKSCGKGAHIGYNCPLKIPIISNPEPCNQTMNDELPQTLPSFDPTCYFDKENLVPCVLKPNFVDESSNIFSPPPQPHISSCEFCGSNAQYGHYCTPQVPFINPELDYTSPAIVEPLRIELPFLEDRFQEDPPEVSMANNRTMAKLLQGATRIWLEKEPPRSILTWEDLVTKFINQFFPPSKTTNLRNEITRFQQRFDESFYEAWDRINDLLRACPHHGFFELHQLETFYNAVNVNDQDSLNSVAGGNFLDKMPRECHKIIESKSKVSQSRAKAFVAKVSTSSSTPVVSSEIFELKDMVRALLLDKKNQSSAQLHLILLLQLKQLSRIVLLAVVPTRTKIVPLLAETFIETTSKSQLLRPQVNQPPAYQALAYQAPIPQIQSVSKTDFESYVKANDAVLRNMQNQGQNLQIQMAN
nr:reverse transcriptase domain-containing protein [Tanacetum cinerariifolium]